MGAEFQIRPVGRDARSGWYWRLVGANGEPMATSETYTRHADAVRGAEDARAAAAEAELVDEAGGGD